MRGSFLPWAFSLAALVCSGCTLRAPAASKIEVGSVIKATSESGETASVKVESIVPDPLDTDKEVYLYGLSVESDQAGIWEPYCEPDDEGQALAIPLQGFWISDGSYVDDPKSVTFACTNGVIAKCVRWGYKPWKVVNGTSLKDMHLACVRMARADYCGNGIGHTRDGTPINIYDVLGIQIPDRTTMTFEAAWSPAGVTYLQRPRFGDIAAIYLECPERLDGRTANDFPVISREEIVAKWPETLIFNDS